MEISTCRYEQEWILDIFYFYFISFYRFSGYIYIWRFLRRCPVLNLTFGKTDQAVGHRGGGGGEGWGGVGERKAPPGQLLSHNLREPIMQVFKLECYKIDLFYFIPTFFCFSSPVMCLLHFHLSVIRLLSFWLHYKTKYCGYYFCVMPGSNELALSGVLEASYF